MKRFENFSQFSITTIAILWAIVAGITLVYGIMHY